MTTGEHNTPQVDNGQWTSILLAKIHKGTVSRNTDSMYKETVSRNTDNR